MTPGLTDAWTLGVIVAMGLVTLLTRCFFFILDRQRPLPGWVSRALNYAPVAALAAVIAPEIVMTAGQLVQTWQNARLFGVLAGIVAHALRGNLLLTLLAGMATYLPLHIGLGW